VLATGHAAGFYRIIVYARCTTAGTTGDTTVIGAAYNDGAASGATAFGLQNGGGTTTIYVSLTATTNLYSGQREFYSSGNAAITVNNNSTVNTGGAVFTIRARLKYLGE
jgi:hypothetical protein